MVDTHASSMTSNPLNDPGIRDQDLEHAYKFFELHAGQRMALFNFFLVLSGLVLAGIATTFQNPSWPPALGIVLGGLLSLISFVFWKLDQRAAFLVKHSEIALSTIERSLIAAPARIFASEPDAWATAQRSLGVFLRPRTYGYCFRVIFFAMGVVGLASCVGYISESLFTSDQAPVEKQLSIKAGAKC